MSDEIKNQVTAWDDENSNVIIYGTHDAKEAMDAFHAYYRECGFTPESDEWDEQLNDLSFFEDMARLWTEPKGEEVPFDTLKEPAPGLDPYMVGSL